MIVYVNEKYFKRAKTGKGKFTARLVEAFPRHGVKVATDPKKKAEIGLHIGRCHELSDKVKKNVLRVGPACIDTNMKYRKINKEKAESVKKVDGIIYQSEYSRKAYHKFVCKPDMPEKVIFNGADPKAYAVEPYESNYGINFLASTRVWLNQKRGKQIIRAFVEAAIPDSFLLFCGDDQGLMKKYYETNNIMFFGPVSDKVLARLYKLATAFIHLTYVDACPNSVVEAQVAGCPVICTDQGGTHEIVFNGKILPDKQFKFKATDLNKPPKVRRHSLIAAMREIVDIKFNSGLRHEAPNALCIDTVAQQYNDFFEEVLNV